MGLKVFLWAVSKVGFVVEMLGRRLSRAVTTKCQAAVAAKLLFP